MKVHEIIAEIRKDCPVNPLTELKTSPIFMEQLREYYSESHDGERCWYVIDLIDNLLLCKLSLGQFIAADKDGKPLKMSFKVRGQAGYGEINQDYEKAQQGVIFEGWEVLKQDHKNAIQMHNTSTGFSLERLFNGEFWLWSPDSSLSLQIKTIADLAAATTENPLKLK